MFKDKYSDVNDILKEWHDYLIWTLFKDARNDIDVGIQLFSFSKVAM